ncbi:putative zinc metalloprotease [Porphyridium purpureum]|uniref:Putative zinc metalloprotease n=1 Tax=Porphyridium purpureum TaxID=35688 RepID=A0A5J4Z0L9_PORPP|nr:putative zinc metalloprotease [Porphyridium purpureum]|eukprot:POR8968..scf208_2
MGVGARGAVRNAPRGEFPCQRVARRGWRAPAANSGAARTRWRASAAPASGSRVNCRRGLGRGTRRQNTCVMSAAAPLAQTAELVASGLSSFAPTAVGLGILAFIIVVHEAGHFFAARLQGIRVKDFSVGFGPKLLAYKPPNQETQFTLRLFPLGGFVAFPEASEIDEVTGEEVKLDDPNLLQNRPVRDRAIVVSAGVLANLALAYVTIFGGVTLNGVPSFEYQPGVVISQLADPSGPGARAGLLKNDVVLSINGLPIDRAQDSASVAANRIRTSRTDLLSMTVRRGENTFDLQVQPRRTPDGDAKIGLQLSSNAVVTKRLPNSVLSALSMTNSEFSRLGTQTWTGLSRIASSTFNFGGANNASGGGVSSVSGPIGVVSMGAEIARTDASALFYFCAVISLNLAIINALPLPALDGGQMAFILAEGLSGRPVPQKVQNTINQTALLVFLLLSGSLIFGDIEKLGGSSSIPIEGMQGPK